MSKSPISETSDSGHNESQHQGWPADQHPYAALFQKPAAATAATPAEVATGPGQPSVIGGPLIPAEAGPMPAASAPSERMPIAGAPAPSEVGPIGDIYAGRQGAAAPEMPAPVMKAIESGTPIRFSSAGENEQAKRQPDYFMTTEGQLVPNPQAQPSPDGSINIQIQTQKQEDNKSLRDAITHESDMQKQSAKEMIRLFQQAHPGESVPGWMNDLANAKPNLPDFVPFNPPPGQPPSAPPENGFQPRGVHGGGSGGSSGFAGNGGFDGGGNFKGNGGAGDGTLHTGGTDSKGQPLGPGETVAAKEIFDYMTQKHGIPPAIASGILGNMQTESSFKTNAYNKGEGAIGLCQWEGGRRTNLENFAKQEGKPVTDWHVQVDFMMHELKGSESGAWSKIQQTSTPEDAARAFDKYYERSSGAAREQRAGNAASIDQKFNAKGTAMA